MSAYNSPALLLEALTARGVILHRNGDRLAFDAPRGAIGEFLPDIQRFKLALLELLERPDKAPETAPEAPLIAETPLLSPKARNGPLTAVFEVDGAAEIRALARAILETRRPNGGFDFGKVKPYWRAANALTGQNMTSPELASWAREISEDK